jgi:hypothetical protein
MKPATTIIRVTPDYCEACGRRHKSVLTLGHAFRQREIRSGRSDPGLRHKSVLTLGHAFRQREIRSGRSDPGLLCFGCAELWANVLRTGSTGRCIIEAGCRTQLGVPPSS